MLPVVVAGGTVLYRAASMAKSAFARITLPATKSGWPAIRSAMVARMKSLYDAVPDGAKSVITSVVIGAGIAGVVDLISGWNKASEDDIAFATLLINLANQGVNPDHIAPPEYTAKLGDEKLKAMFDNARSAYAAYVAAHGNPSDEYATDSGLEGQQSSISDVEVVRAVAQLFGIHNVNRLVDVQALLKRYVAMDPKSIAIAGQMVHAAGGRL